MDSNSSSDATQQDTAESREYRLNAATVAYAAGQLSVLYGDKDRRRAAARGAFPGFPERFFNVQFEMGERSGADILLQRAAADIAAG